MLILTRKMGEIVMIGDDVEVKVLSIHGKQIRIGVEAPKEVKVHRKEIYDRINSTRGEPSDTDSRGNI